MLVKKMFWNVGVVAALISSSLAAVSQQAQEGPVTTRATIAVDSKQPVELDPAKLKVQVNGHQVPVDSLVHVKPNGVQLAILVDEGLRTSFALQLSDMKEFLMSLPPEVQVQVGYMQNGTVLPHQGFSSDHATVAQGLHIPEGLAGASASPYFCLSDFVKHWPSQEPATRVVLMLTNGVDPYNGSTSVLNQDSPYVQTAAEDAQRAGVAVYSIPYHEAGLPGGAGSFSGQSYLTQVAEATGGQLLYEGSFNPVAIKPFLNKLQTYLAESYTATFQANATHEKDNTLDRLKVTTSQPGVKVHAPEAVHPGLPD